jgi:hypothetical protein
LDGLGSLMNVPERASLFKDSDIDLFLYGLTEEEANEKLKNIYFIVQSNTKVLIDRVHFVMTVVHCSYHLFNNDTFVWFFWGG